jgi:hypothetical protein
LGYTTPNVAFQVELGHGQFVKRLSNITTKSFPNYREINKIKYREIIERVRKIGISNRFKVLGRE